MKMLSKSSSLVPVAAVALLLLLAGGLRCTAKKSEEGGARSARVEEAAPPSEGESAPAPESSGREEPGTAAEECGHVVSAAPAAMDAGTGAAEGSPSARGTVVKADRVAPRENPAATGKATTGPEAGRLLARPPKGKKGRRGRQGKPRELKTVGGKKKTGDQAKAGQEGKRRVQISQSGRARKPHPTPIEDITAYRKEPVKFITRFKDRRVLDLENADFDADVLAVVDGRKITKNDFRMGIVDSLGALAVDRFLTAILTERMKKKLVAGGADPARFEVSEKTVDNEINNQMMMAKQQDRSGQFEGEAWKKLIDQSLGWENYRNMQKSVLAFGKVYLPEITPKKKEEGSEGAKKEPVSKKEEQPLDPDLPAGKDSQGKTVNIYMPLHTWKALGIDESSRHIRDSLNTAYRDGTPLGAFIRPQYIRTVKDAVVKGTKVKYHSSAALPEGVYMRVGDRDVTLDEIYPIVAAPLTRDDLEQVLSEMLVYAAMDKVLDEGGWTLSGEEFEKAFAEHEKQYEGTLFPLAFIMNLHGYYQKEDYKKMYRRRLAYAKMLEAQGGMTDEILKNFFEKGARLFYQNGGVKIQSIFFGVYDHKAMKVRENGFAWARAKMKEVLDQLSSGAGFLEVAKKYEDVNGFHRPAETDYMTRNDFRYSFGEKTKSILATGYCLADDCFYNAVPGDVIGPLEVRYSEFGNPVFKGEYLVKVVGFRTMLDLNPFEQSKPTVKEDYLDLNFLNWAARTMAAAHVELTSKKS